LSGRWIANGARRFVLGAAARLATKSTKFVTARLVAIDCTPATSTATGDGVRACAGVTNLGVHDDAAASTTAAPTTKLR
jgi:hypothetical protein